MITDSNQQHFKWTGRMIKVRSGNGYGYDISLIYNCDYEGRPRCSSAGGGAIYNRYPLIIGKYYYYGNIAGFEQTKHETLEVVVADLSEKTIDSISKKAEETGMTVEQVEKRISGGGIA
jgi:hypothetical protein